MMEAFLTAITEFGKDLGIVSLFSKKPEPTNDTLREIWRHSLAQEEELAASRRQAEEEREARVQAEADLLAYQQRAQEQYRAELAAAQRRSDEEATSRRKAEADQFQAELAAFKNRSDAEHAAKLKDLEERARASAGRAEEQHQADLAAAKRRADEELEAMRLRAKDERAAFKQREKAAMEREGAAEEAARVAKSALHRGIQPVVWPTKAQYSDAMKRIKYDEEKLHFAICGSSGSGKSSLVNAFRGLKSKQSSAAKVGVTETTLKIDRYPDRRREYPYSRFVWYDIPGAGTLKVRDWQYFNDQGLFIFDFIVVVYDVRFTRIDAGIIENCHRFNIPVFVVRSKADQHISNMALEDECELSDPGYEKTYQELKAKFIQDTRSNFSAQMEILKEDSLKREQELSKTDAKYARESHFESSHQLWLPKQRVYIVSAKNVRAMLSAGCLNHIIPIDDTSYIDERPLFDGLLSAAASRRYSEADRLEALALPTV